MTLLELAAQGIEGLPAGRWSFRPGLNAVAASPEAAAGLGRVMQALLFPETVAFSGAAGARAGVTFLGADGATYRLVGGIGLEVALSQLDPATSRFVPMPVEGGGPRILRGLGLPERRLFAPLLWFAPAEAKPPPATPGEVPSGTPSGRGIESKLSQLTAAASVPQKPRTLRDLRARLTEVEAEEKSASELEELQFQLDGLQQKLFQIEDTLKGVERLRSDRDQATQELAKLPAITEEAVAQVKRLPQLIQKRDETLKRIADERLALDEAAQGGGSLASLGQDRLFVVGMSVGALSVAGAVVGSGFVPDLRWVALLDIPFFGVATLRLCQQLGAMRSRQGVSRKAALLADREGRTAKTFEAESKEARALMKTLGVEAVTELEERLATRTALLERQQQALERLGAVEVDPEIQQAVASRDQLRQQVEGLEAKLAGFGGYRRDPGEVRQELEELRTEVAKLGGTEPTDIKLALDGRPPPDEAAALLHGAGELFAMTPAMLLSTVRDRAAQYVGALTERRFGGPAFGPDGGVTFARTGAEPLPFSLLPAADRDPCLWALRLVLAERWLSNHRLFLWFDERLAAEDEPRRQLLARILQGLARNVQVVWLGGTAQPLANHAVTVG
ncbi:MAG: ATP-binding protein [Myxococcales bacterium]